MTGYDTAPSDETESEHHNRIRRARYNEDDDYRESVIASVKRYQKKLRRDPKRHAEFKKRKRENARRLMADPERRRAYNEYMRNYMRKYHRRRKGDPEYRARINQRRREYNRRRREGGK